MISYMLSNIICETFEKEVGKHQHETGKAMHIGFDLTTSKSRDQYRVCHMYIHAPANYVHVATQSESIDKDGAQHWRPMCHIGYHDSCWRDSIQSFIFQNREELSVFRSFDLFSWYDVVTLSKVECDYLYLLERERTAYQDEDKIKLQQKIKEFNPFNERSLWPRRD